jgi:hypothetical protein
MENNQLISVITKADKENTLVIMYKDKYMKKTDEYIIGNDFIKLPNSVTNRHKITIGEQINKCKNIIKCGNTPHSAKQTTPTGSKNMRYLYATACSLAVGHTHALPNQRS